MKKATHMGTCQICGRMHKVDVKYGVVAAHGYTRQWGNEHNHCPGGQWRPYEVTNARAVQLKEEFEQAVTELRKATTLTDNEIKRNWRDKEATKIRGLDNAIEHLGRRIEKWEAKELTPIK